MLKHGRLVRKAIGRLKWSIPFTIERRHVSVTDNGRANVTVEQTAVKGNVQPSNGEDLQRLPEGDRTGDFITIHALVELQAGRNTVQADQIIYNGKRYLVKSVDSWTDHGYWCAVAALMGEAGNG